MAKENKNVRVKKDSKEKKNSSFLKDSKAELKKVTWPTPKQLASKTAIVIAIVLVIAIIVFVLDTAFDKGYEFIVNKATKNNTSQTATEDANEVNVTTVDATEDASIDLTGAKVEGEDSSTSAETTSDNTVTE